MVNKHPSNAEFILMLVALEVSGDTIKVIPWQTLTRMENKRGQPTQWKEFREFEYLQKPR